MVDITKCHGQGCPLKDKCYRYTAEPDPYMQSYFAKAPYENGVCANYWEVEEPKKEKRKDK